MNHRTFTNDELLRKARYALDGNLADDPAEIQDVVPELVVRLEDGAPILDVASTYCNDADELERYLKIALVALDWANTPDELEALLEKSE